MQPTNVSHLHFLVVTMTFDSIKPGVGRFRRCRTQKLKIQSKAKRYEAMTAVLKNSRRKHETNEEGNYGKVG